MTADDNVMTSRVRHFYRQLKCLADEIGEIDAHDLAWAINEGGFELRALSIALGDLQEVVVLAEGRRV